MKKLKNSLELPIPTRNTRKFANKLMTDTSGEINLQSKDIISHVAKVKPTTSAHSVADIIPFLACIINYSLQTQRFDKGRNMYFTHSKEKVITRTFTFKFLVCKQSLFIHG